MHERFWSKVDKGDPNKCWEWQAGKDGHGYGAFKIAKKQYQAHRVAYELTFGTIPAGVGYHGTCVCHHCDNPACCNPNHLFLGTAADNSKDQASKGLSKAAKLTPDEIREIRRLRNEGAKQKVLAKKFGVDASTISRICARKAWVLVQDDTAS